MTTIVDAEHPVARTSISLEDAERWKKHHAEAFSRLSDGTTVIINMATGDYVTADTWFAAHDAFDAPFGTENHPGFSFTVGRPIFVGGGPDGGD